MPGLGELLSRSYERFKAGWLALTLWWLGQLAAIVLPVLILAGAGLLLFGVALFQDPGAAPAGPALLSFALLALLILGLAGLLWTRLSLAWYQAALQPAQSMASHWRATAGLLWPAAWAWSLWVFVYLGLLACLIAPALLALPWLAAAPVLFLTEGRAGLGAFWAGRALVQGRWWAVSGPLLVVWVINGALGSLPVAGQIASLLFGSSFLMVFTTETVLAARASRPAGAAPAAAPVLWAAAWGWILIAGGLIAAALLIPGVGEFFERLWQGPSSAV